MAKQRRISGIIRKMGDDEIVANDNVDAAIYDTMQKYDAVAYEADINIPPEEYESFYFHIPEENAQPFEAELETNEETHKIIEVDWDAPTYVMPPEYSLPPEQETETPPLEPPPEPERPSFEKPSWTYTTMEYGAASPRPEETIIPGQPLKTYPEQEDAPLPPVPGIKEPSFKFPPWVFPIAITGISASIFLFLWYRRKKKLK